VTKLLTGTAIMRAVEKGKLASLSTPIAPIIDPLLKDLGLGSLRDLFGKEAEKFLNAKHLGTMKSGVPDYDTAKPYPKPPTDAFRAQCYQQPSREWDPADILNVSWVATGRLEFFPGLRQSYSSTNFVLLGLLLAALDEAPSWDAYDQRGTLDALPAARRDLYKAMEFAVHGAPSGWTSVHGFDRTSYNGQNASARPGKDVWNVKGVYGGWTASDITASVADTARLGYDIFGQKGARLLQPSSVQTMIPTGGFYGFATFNLSHGWGQPSGSPYNTAYGHLGATYGYQSIVAYFPALDVSISVASNIETDEQAQPSDTLCIAYNAVLASLTNTSEPKCEFVQKGYYGGECKCTRSE
jgi:CubicO group peptidase (beta-lactamase class C family)